MCSQIGHVPHGKNALINRQASLKAALAVCNMMNSHCGDVTTNVSDKQKHPRIKDYKPLNFL